MMFFKSFWVIVMKITNFIIHSHNRAYYAIISISRSV